MAKRANMDDCPMQTAAHVSVAWVRLMGFPVPDDMPYVHAARHLLKKFGEPAVATALADYTDEAYISGLIP